MRKFLSSNEYYFDEDPAPKLPTASEAKSAIETVINFCDSFSNEDSTHKYSEVDFKEMLGFLIDNLFVIFSNQIFQQTVGIPMSTNCAHLSADLFLYTYETEFIQKLLREKNKPLAVVFNSAYRYIDNDLSIKND
jgi:hypothetical protein